MTHMASLAARLLGRDLTILGLRDWRQRNPFEKLAAGIPRRRGSETCLLICPTPGALWALTGVDGWRRNFGTVAAWVIDSFWIDRIPWLVRRSGPIDTFFVTNMEEIEPWEAATRRPCHWLPWGTDALGLGSAASDRPVDVLRVGRQPPAWDDDGETGEACRSAGITFEGRPPAGGDPAQNMRMLTGRLAQAKFTLAFSNRVNPRAYTHPTREYVTARWVDGLASGATIAGVHPDTETVRNLLWPEGLLDLDPSDRGGGVARIAEAVRRWNPGVARWNNLLALERLDWRWRFERIATTLGGSYPALDSELGRLREAIAERRANLVRAGSTC
ncbi:MAG: hypothetical protein WB493_01015 [Anaeromyxobacteraceae bacterium]